MLQEAIGFTGVIESPLVLRRSFQILNTLFYKVYPCCISCKISAALGNISRSAFCQCSGTYAIYFQAISGIIISCLCIYGGEFQSNGLCLQVNGADTTNTGDLVTITGTHCRSLLVYADRGHCEQKNYNISDAYSTFSLLGNFATKTGIASSFISIGRCQGKFLLRLAGLNETEVCLEKVNLIDCEGRYLFRIGFEVDYIKYFAAATIKNAVSVRCIFQNVDFIASGAVTYSECMLDHLPDTVKMPAGISVVESPSVHVHSTFGPEVCIVTLHKRLKIIVIIMHFARALHR